MSGGANELLEAGFSYNVAELEPEVTLRLDIKAGVGTIKLAVSE